MRSPVVALCTRMSLPLATITYAPSLDTAVDLVFSTPPRVDIKHLTYATSHHEHQPERRHDHCTAPEVCKTSSRRQQISGRRPYELHALPAVNRMSP
jgi:hypothetical protein